MLGKLQPCDLGEEYGRTLTLYARKATECSMLSELFCNNLGGKNIECNADIKGLVCEVLERS